MAGGVRAGHQSRRPLRRISTPAQPHTASAQTTTLAVRHLPPVPVAGFNVVIVREGDAGEQQIALPMLLRNLRLRLMGLGIFT